MHRGVVYHSLGQRYADQSALAARALKATNPSLGAALFTDDLAYAQQAFSDVFDFILPLSDSPSDDELIAHLTAHKRLASLKVAIVDRSPFQQTLFIDSDTVAIKDISPAFDLLTDFDMLLCTEVEHHIDMSDGWHAFGLKDNRLRGFYNAGVIFCNSQKDSVLRFMRAWKKLMLEGDEVIQRSDQDALNHMIASPIEFMPDIRFSGSALKTREYNAFCRYWREIWDYGLFNEVRIVHTFLTDRIAPTVIEKQRFDWVSLIENREADVGPYINRFVSGLDTVQKKEYAATVLDRNVSLKQFTDYTARKLGNSRAEDYALLFGVSSGDTGFDIVRPLHRLLEQNKLPTKANVTQIGMQTPNPTLPLYNSSKFFIEGNDLEYLAELFEADVTAISRCPFLGFKARNIKTLHAEFAVQGNLSEILEPNQSLIFDIDNSIPTEIRISNAVESKPFLEKDGIYMIVNTTPSAAEEMARRLASDYSVSVLEGAVWLTHKEVGLPTYLPNYTPASTAKIALLGNCQASALASILRRVKGIKVEILVDVNNEGSDGYKDAHWAAAHTDRVDFCFSQPLSDNFGEISSDRLRSKYERRFMQYTNLYFTGFHPDLIYFGARNFRLQSAMGDYNSRIALIGYLKSLSVDETLKLFSDRNYQKLNYYGQFEASKTELLRRDNENDIKFATKFFEIAKNRLPLYTVNHPTAHVLTQLAAAIVAATGQARPEINVDNVRNPLVDNSIWPVYPEVASALGLEYSGSTIFYPGLHEDLEPMSIRDFIGISYQRYDEAGRGKIFDVPGAAEMAATELANNE